MKRAGDLVAAAVLIVVLSPVLVIVGIAVRVALGSPVLFTSERAGLHGRRFRLVKFRSMRPGDGPDETRLTRFGRLLRRTSLDELPELWNVLRGDMSLVGPRPLPPEYLPRYSPQQARRHEVRPGLTGWAQVKGRNSLAWDERLAMDVWYVDHHNAWLDLRILAMTIPAVVRARGITAPGHATMPEFLGPETGDAAS